jgi:hypothetical protein
MTKRRALIVAGALLLLGSMRLPAPIMEESTPVPTAPPAKSDREMDLSDFATKKRAAQPKASAPNKSKAEDETTPPHVVTTAPAESKQKRFKKTQSEGTAPRTAAAPAAPVPSKGFSGTWKGRMTDGDWIVMVNPTETNVIARCGVRREGGVARVEGGTLFWSHITPSGTIRWSMSMSPGGRQAQATAFHVSGNNSGTFEKID